MERPTTVLWFRGADLRLSDNPAVAVATGLDGPVVPLFVHDAEAAGPWGPGTNALAWLGRSVASLEAELEAAGSRLVARNGSAERVLSDVVRHTGASRVVFSRRWEPWALAQEERVSAELRGLADVSAVSANLIAEPGTVLSGGGTPYKVFTPFWKRWRQEPPELAVLTPAPRQLFPPEVWPDSERVPDGQIGSLSGSNEAAEVLAHWTPGELGARRRLDRFVEEALSGYETDRDRPDLSGTSRLSPHLAHGEISAVRVVHEVREASRERGAQSHGESFVRQLAWREFSAHVLAATPELPEQPVRERFEEFPWREDPDALEAWQRGETGYTIVDAGMRELLGSGWMHNRVRMLVASFLTKDLLVPWQVGERWFWDHLVDADLANNAFGWQWVAGCGHDAAPYFRIFNPVAQGRRFDPNGDYVRSWVPEAESYPEPIVDHGEARRRALAAYELRR